MTERGKRVAAGICGIVAGILLLSTAPSFPYRLSVLGAAVLVVVTYEDAWQQYKLWRGRRRAKRCWRC